MMRGISKSISSNDNARAKDFVVRVLIPLLSCPGWTLDLSSQVGIGFKSSWSKPNKLLSYEFINRRKTFLSFAVFLNAIGVASSVTVDCIRSC